MSDNPRIHNVISLLQKLPKIIGIANKHIGLEDTFPLVEIFLVHNPIPSLSVHFLRSSSSVFFKLILAFSRILIHFKAMSIDSLCLDSILILPYTLNVSVPRKLDIELSSI